jgi:hypothetical protein
MNNRSAWFFGLLALALLHNSCKKDDPNDGNARMRAIHASPDAPGVDFLVDDVKQNTAPLNYPGSTGYFSVSAGTRNIKINLSSGGTNVINGNITLEKNKAYSVFAGSRASSLVALAAEDNLANPATGKAHIRFFHLSPGSPNISFGTLVGSTYTALYTNRSFETQTSMNSFSGFTPTDAGTYTMEARVSGTTGSLFTANGVNLQSGKIYTLYAQGLLGSATTPPGLGIVVHNE